MPQSSRPILLWMLVAGLVISTVLATKVELDKRQLAAAYDQARTALTQLEQERTHLTQELTGARQTIQDQTNDLTGLEQELNQLQVRFDEAEQEVHRLQLEHVSLKQENQSLAQRLAATMAEQQALQARLSSLKELKVAIRDVKRKIRQERWQAWVASVNARRADDQRKLEQGNRGFVVWRGVPTLGSPTKLQVRVLEPQTTP